MGCFRRSRARDDLRRLGEAHSEIGQSAERWRPGTCRRCFTRLSAANALPRLPHTCGRRHHGDEPTAQTWDDVPAKRMSEDRVRGQQEYGRRGNRAKEHAHDVVARDMKKPSQRKEVKTDDRQVERRHEFEMSRDGGDRVDDRKRGYFSHHDPGEPAACRSLFGRARRDALRQASGGTNHSDACCDHCPVMTNAPMSTPSAGGVAIMRSDQVTNTALTAVSQSAPPANPMLRERPEAARTAEACRGQHDRVRYWDGRSIRRLSGCSAAHHGPPGSNDPPPETRGPSERPAQD